MGLNFESFVNDIIKKFLDDGSELTSEKEKAKRQEICQGCDYFGTVHPLYFISGHGCTVCGCPMETKTHFKTITRIGDKVGDMLTAKEILQLRLHLVKDGDKEIETVKCPKGKW